MDDFSHIPVKVKRWNKKWDSEAHRRFVDIGYRHGLNKEADMPTIMHPILAGKAREIEALLAPMEATLGQMSTLSRNGDTLVREIRVDEVDWWNLDRLYYRLEKTAYNLRYDYFGLYQVLIMNFKEGKEGEDAQ